MMSQRLLNTIDKEDILDLMAYLVAVVQSNHQLFAKYFKIHLPIQFCSL